MAPVVSPQVVVVQESFWDILFKRISAVVPLSILNLVFLVLCLFISIYALYKIYSYKLKIRTNIEKTESIINKSFEILEEDIDEADKNLRKEIRKDLHDAEKIIKIEVKNLDK